MPIVQTLRNRRLFTLMVVVLLATTPGCGKRKARPSQYPAQVHGTITLDAAPMPTGTITFVPIASEEQGGRVGIARVDADGHYRIGNANPDKPSGLIPGSYKVTILAMTPDPTGTGDPIAELAIPERYTDLRTTPFQVTVAAGEKRHDFDLQR